MRLGWFILAVFSLFSRSFISFHFICVPKHVQLQFISTLTRVLSDFGACSMHASANYFRISSTKHITPTTTTKDSINVYSHFAYFKRIKQGHYLHTFTPFCIFYISLATKFPAGLLFFTFDRNSNENNTQERLTHANDARSVFKPCTCRCSGSLGRAPGILCRSMLRYGA